MAKVLFSSDAYIDIQSIQDYVEQELENPEAAVAIVDKIVNSINNLIDFPLSGVSLNNKIEIPNEYRYIVIGSYVSFYRYKEDTIFIDRILYARRDYMRILFGKSMEAPTGEE